MSLEAFLNRKPKRKTKRILNTKDLYERIIDTNPPPKSDTDKVNEDSLPQASADNDEWEPIQNDMIPDIAGLGITDLVDEDKEDETEALNAAKDAAKARSSKVAWESKPKNEEEPKKVEEEPKKVGVYVPSAFRQAEKSPNVDSLEDFPTLDAVKEKPKKTEPVKSIDNSWTDVNRGPGLRRRDELNSVALPNRSDGSNRSVPPVSRDGFPSRGGWNHPGDSQPSSRPWTRGETIKSSVPISTPAAAGQKSGTFDRRPGITSTSKPYVPPSLRNPAPISQSNRYAQFGDS